MSSYISVISKRPREEAETEENLQQQQQLIQSESSSIVQQSKRAKSSSSLLFPSRFVGYQEEEETEEPVFRPRSSLLRIPDIQLSGHNKAISGLKFDPKLGDILATSCREGKIIFWDIFHSWSSTADPAPCPAYATLTPHNSPISSLAWSSDAETIYSSHDKVVALSDVETGKLIKFCRGHSGKIVDISVSKHSSSYSETSESLSTILYTVGLDKTIRIWDVRVRDSVTVFSSPNKLTSIESNGSNQFFVGTTTPYIPCFDVRAIKSHKTTSSPESMRSWTGPKSTPVWERYGTKPLHVFSGHKKGITGLAVSSLFTESEFLVSASLDATLSIYSLQSPSPNDSRIQLTGFKQNWEKHYLKPSISQDYVAIGSADKSVVIWNRNQSETEIVDTTPGTGITPFTIAYIIPGHIGTPTYVDLHPNQPIIASGDISGACFIHEIPTFD